MWFLPDLPVTIGYLPIAEPCDIARALGIPMGEAACDILAARRIEPLDIGKIADRYFLTEAIIRNTTASVDVGGSFRIRPVPMGTIVIRNLGLPTSDGTDAADAKDGWLELSVEPTLQEEPSGWHPFHKRQNIIPCTRIFMKRGSVESAEPVDVLVDGQQLNGFGFSIGIIPKKFSIITGRKKRLIPVSDALSNPLRFDMLTPAQ
jgi:hypothetical protein